jgi:hypothetical protein
MLLKNIPIRLIAALHNTSVGQIQRNYSKHITEHHSDVAPRCSRTHASGGQHHQVNAIMRRAGGARNAAGPGLTNPVG